eukprot:3445782-Rhodomonas_salina.2
MHKLGCRRSKTTKKTRYIHCLSCYAMSTVLPYRAKPIVLRDVSYCQTVIRDVGYCYPIVLLDV